MWTIPTLTRLPWTSAGVAAAAAADAHAAAAAAGKIFFFLKPDLDLIMRLQITCTILASIQSVYNIYALHNVFVLYSIITHSHLARAIIYMRIHAHVLYISLVI